ncbi:hypothetical protein [uncultured Winogradskyella sp.]|uniref:hypothetical protein n=1 Tax=uncultured Winogradskyella sp. TaxID=395353 RepID=UPI0026360AEE|nr:hypothetical protein [uncultured Winogradskyella sp.]
MTNKDIIYKHRMKVKYTSIILLLVGIAIAYFYYGTEPHETIGGFLCGLGFGLFLIYIAIKQPKKIK